jgi:heme exporter protein D
MVAERIVEFLRMGGYAGFVWPAYAVAALVMGALLAQSLRRYRKAQRALDDLQSRRPRRRGAT